MSYVYFIKCEQFVKIGYSERPVSERINAMQTGCPFYLTLLGYFDGPIDTKFEHILHSRFNNYHYRGEWFLLSPVLEWLEELPVDKSIKLSFSDEIVYFRKSPKAKAPDNYTTNINELAYKLNKLSQEVSSIKQIVAHCVDENLGVSQEKDIIDEFLFAKTKRSKYGEIQNKELYSLFCSFCYEHSYIKIIGRNEFYKSLAEKGYAKKRYRDGKTYIQFIEIKEAE